MAYLRSIYERKCRCGKRATKELVNRANASIAECCEACSKIELKRLNAIEEADRKRIDQRLDDIASRERFR